MKYWIGVSVSLVTISCGIFEEEPKRRAPVFAARATCTVDEANHLRCNSTVLQQCDFGKWQTVETCQNGCDPGVLGQGNASCKGGLPAGVCSPAGAFRCAGDVVESCSGTAWMAVADCSLTAEQCDPTSGTCVPAAPCIDGDARCNGTNAEQCAGGIWTLSWACTVGQTCVQSSPTTAACQGGPTGCTDGHSRCDGNALEWCDAGEWFVATTCTNGQVCTPTSMTSAECLGGPPACNDGDTRCSDDMIELCNQGDWTPAVNCLATMQTCAQISATQAQCQGGVPPECTASDFRCFNNAAQWCPEGSWSTLQACTIDQVCTEQASGAPICETVVASACDGTRQSTCDGADVVACMGTTEGQRASCADIAATCYEPNGTDRATCMMGVGGQCWVSTEQGVGFFPCGSGGVVSTSMACDVIDGCRTGTFGACTQGSFTPTCIDANNMALDCMQLSAAEPGQLLLVNCSKAEYGNGSCVGTTCENTDVGDPCQAGLIQCASPLQCSTTTPGMWGTCG